MTSSLDELRGRDFLDISDLSRDELVALIDRAAQLKEKRPELGRGRLAGKSVAMIFEKASTRTRVSFQVGIGELGGSSVFLSPTETQLGRGEPIEDTARVLSGYVHGIVCRTGKHERLMTLARAASVPVINALSDRSHPCQILADLLTAKEEFGSLADLTFAWVGDGNNVAHSWIHASAIMGFKLLIACPTTHRPDDEVLAESDRLAQGGTLIEITNNPQKAVMGAHVVSTDVWASMGQEAEAKERREAFSGYCVDDALMANANANAIALHCLPAHRGEEISAELLEGARSRVWRQAENRLHVQKALLESLLSS